MNDQIEDVVHSLEEVSRDVGATLSDLRREQLNWKRDAGSWSVAQCLDHLVTINGLYFPLLEQLSAGAPPATFWERHSPFSGFLGRFLIRRLTPTYPKKMKTTSKGQPSKSEIGPEILGRFARQQEGLIGRLRALPVDLDGAATIVTSPLLGWVTYSLDDCITILAVHEQRHLLQAKRVLEEPGFPSRTELRTSRSFHTPRSR